MDLGQWKTDFFQFFRVLLSLGAPRRVWDVEEIKYSLGFCQDLLLFGGNESEPYQAMFS